VLKDNPKGFGVRGLKIKTSEKCVRNWLFRLYELGYVSYEPKLKRGKKKIVSITEKGLRHLMLLKEIDKLEKEFKQRYRISSEDISSLKFERKLDLYEKLLTDIFDDCLKANYKIALRFLNTTLFVIRKVLDKKQYDIEMEKLFLESIKNALLKPSG